MKERTLRALGLLLIAIGLLAFAANTGMFGVLPAFIRVVLLFVAGGVFWSSTGERLRPWQRIAGFTILGIITMINAGNFSGTVALGYPAMAFSLIYLTSPRVWWALIPAGVLASVTLLVTAETLFPHWDATVLFFLGMAATFTLLYLLPYERGGRRWALYPALLWIILTVVVNDPGSRAPSWLLPLVLIGSGVVILGWWRGNGRSGQ